MPPGDAVPEPVDDFPVVALVTSAGGLHALSTVLSGLPAHLPAAVLVTLHQHPDAPSRLAEILDERCALPVRSAIDGDLLVPGTVHTTPPGRHLVMISPHTLGLIESGAAPRPSADLLLTSLAATCGRRVLAVVLTGKGADGRNGVRVVARCGGTVLAQDRFSSAHFGMPQAAIGTGVVDAVLPLGDIADAIQARVFGRVARPAVTAARGPFPRHG